MTQQQQIDRLCLQLFSVYFDYIETISHENTSN